MFFGHMQYTHVHVHACIYMYMVYVAHDDSYCVNYRFIFLSHTCTPTQYYHATDRKATIPPTIFLGVIAGFVLVVGILVFMVVCALMMLRKQKEKNKVLESGEMS